MPQILQIAAIAVATLSTGAVTLSVMNEDIPDLVVPEGDWVSSGSLDGIAFQINGENVSRGAELTDEIVFRDGTFQSTDCEEYCNFGWSEYKTKEIDGVVHFTTTTICNDAPHTVVWYGQVIGDNVTVDVTWTTRRWYWTNQMALKATGTMMSNEAASG